MGSKRKTDKDKNTLTLEGKLTIEHAQELKKSLTEALKDSDQLHIRLGNVTDVDLSGIQLLCSAHRTAFEMNKDLTIEGDKSMKLHETMTHVGFCRQKECTLDPSINCFQCGGDRKWEKS